MRMLLWCVVYSSCVVIVPCFRLIDLARRLDKADREALTRCALHLTRLEQYPYAAEVYSKMGDHKALINLHVEAKHWDDVSRSRHPDTHTSHLPHTYAHTHKHRSTARWATTRAKHWDDPSRTRHTYTHARTQTRMHAHIHAHPCMHAHTHTGMHAHTHTYTYTHTRRHPPHTSAC
jgi:hypothetical protein